MFCGLGLWSAGDALVPQAAAQHGASNVGKFILGLPYYGRWLLTAARILVDKQYVTLTELSDKIDEVKKRYE